MQSTLQHHRAISCDDERKQEEDVSCPGDTLTGWSNLQFSLSNFQFALLFSDSFPAAFLMRSPRRIQHQLRAIAVSEGRCAFDGRATFAEGVDNLFRKSSESA